MGSEYGGNGSVHWYTTHKKDRNHGKTSHDYHDVDEQPDAGGQFTVTVLDVGQSDFTYDAGTRTLTATVPIKHHPRNYTTQILIDWA